jgi:hypothetical protein
MHANQRYDSVFVTMKLSRCDISLSTSRFNLSLNKGFHNPDPPHKRTVPFGAKIT